MEGANRSGRERLDEETPICAQDPRVGEPGSGEPIPADPVVRERSLQAQKIMVRIAAGGCDQKARLAAPDLDLEGPAAMEELSLIERALCKETLVLGQRSTG